MRLRFFGLFFLIILTALLPSCQGDLEPLQSSLRAGLMQQGTTGEKSQPSPRPESIPAQPAAPEPPRVSTPALAPVCPDSVIQQIVTPASQDQSPVKLTCSVKLPLNALVTRQIVFEGSAANGAVLDCDGGRLQGTAQKGDREAIVVRSIQSGLSWDRPVGVNVVNCLIDGSVRIYGMGRNGEANWVKQSSKNKTHTIDAQAAAPSNIRFERVTISGRDGVPFYVSPGVTNVTLTNSAINGASTSVGIYLDAESAGMQITNNSFGIRTKTREVIAIDGSAHNTITGNRFDNAGNGGIFAYRNCGEGGTIRHQAPSFNRIENNSFSMAGSNNPAIWLNSRNGNRSYCFQDPSHPFGSSLTPMDMAQNNIVENNKATGGRGDAFRNADPSNTFIGNSQ
jgi:parallel beta-helix repeat protein